MFFLVKLPETPCWFHPMFFLFTGSMSQWHLRVWKWWNKPVKSDGYLIVYHDSAHESGRKLGCTSFSDTLSYSPIMPLSSQAELICPDQWPLQTSIMPELGTLSHFTCHMSFVLMEHIKNYDDQPWDFEGTIGDTRYSDQLMVYDYMMVYCIQVFLTSEVNQETGDGCPSAPTRSQRWELLADVEDHRWQL